MIKHLLPILLLTGCTSTSVNVEEIPKPLAQEPVSVQAITVSWQVNEDTGRLSVTPEEGVAMRNQYNQLVSHIKHLKNMICYYENKHTFCEEEEVNE